MGSGKHFALIASLVKINGELDKSMLARFDTLYTVGFYSAALRLIDVIMLPVMGLLESSIVRFFREGENGLMHVVKLTRKIVILPLISTLFAGLLLPVIGETLPLILGPTFKDSTLVLNWLVFLPILLVLRHFIIWVAFATQHENLTTYVYLLAISINIGVGINLIPIISWEGTIIAVYASEITMIFFLTLSILLAESFKNKCLLS
jgi:O-antigen/teichoic acid export membrane protein